MSWPIAVALASAAFNGIVGALAYVRGREQSLYRSFSLLGFSFAFWSLAYVRVWPDFDDRLWMRLLFTPLAWLPGAGLSFVWSYTGLPEESRKRRTAPLYAAGLLALGLLWGGKITLLQFRAAFIFSGLPIFALALGLLFAHWRKAQDAEEKNRRGYLLLATAIAVIGGFTDFLPAAGVPFLSLANLALMLYSVIVLLAISRHHLLDLRSALGQALGLGLAALLLGALLTLLAWLTRAMEGRLFLNFFLVSLLLTAALPPLWERYNAAFNRWFFSRQARRERDLEALERALDGVWELEGIESAVKGAVRSAWGAEAELLWENKALRGIESPASLPAGLRAPLGAEPAPSTLAVLRRGRAESGGPGGRDAVLETMEARAAEAVVPVLREGELIAAVFVGAPSQGYFDLSAVRWLRRLGQSIARAARSAELARGLLRADRL
ncbi:MAG: histidine kinase N-terminal 7TM domain-containing protein, partial [Elusimicrobiota bacterium]